MQHKFDLFWNDGDLNPITPRVSDQRLLPGEGGSLGPGSFFQLIWTSFRTHRTIIEQFIVKGGHQ